METRDYTRITHRIHALSAPYIQCETVGHVEEHPVHLVHVRKNADAPHCLLLTGGVHGDEPAGVEAALRFLEREDHPDPFQFCVLPCVNPTGYIRNTRENTRGVDLNRAFEKDDIPEVQIVKHTLQTRQFTGFVDFHEDWEATGFYLYEGRRTGPRIGADIIEKIKPIGPIDLDRDEDDPPDSPGAYRVAVAWGTQGLAPYVLHFHAPYVLISETPTAWEMDRRVAAHHTALDTVLDHLSNTA